MGGGRNNEKILPIHFIFLLHIRGRCGHDRMVVGFTTTYAISLSPLKLWLQIPLTVRCTQYTLCDKICRWVATGRWFSLGTLVSSINKSDRHDITEILLKVKHNNPTHPLSLVFQVEVLSIIFDNFDLQTIIY
jgi:hypothetical protein